MIERVSCRFGLSAILKPDSGGKVPKDKNRVETLMRSEEQMNEQHWKISELPWDQFDASKVDPDVLAVAKAASLVEYNARDYATYLGNVFKDDESFRLATIAWAEEEVQHGEALGQWAMRADPSFNFKDAVARYNAGYKIELDVNASIRGSHAGELIARCIVETGTSSYYTALADSCDEPVLKAICRNIASDELRHYKLFYSYLKQYIDRDSLNRLQRLKIGISRIGESEDDELAYAYYAANAPKDAVYDHKTYNRIYAAQAYRFYRPHHVERVVAMVFKACGLKPHTVWQGIVNKAAWQLLKARKRKAVREAA
jgi:rubrerythrin